MVSKISISLALLLSTCVTFIYYSPNFRNTPNTSSITTRNEVPLSEVLIQTNGTIHNDTAAFSFAKFYVNLIFYYTNGSQVSEVIAVKVVVSRPGGSPSYDFLFYDITNGIFSPPPHQAHFLTLPCYPTPPPWLGELWVEFIPCHNNNETPRNDIIKYSFRYWNKGLLTNYYYTQISDDFENPSDRRAIAGTHIIVKACLQIKGTNIYQPSINITSDINVSMSIGGNTYYDVIHTSGGYANLTVPDWVDGVYNVMFNISHPHVVTYIDPSIYIQFNFTKWNSYITVENMVKNCDEKTPFYIRGVLTGEVDEYGSVQPLSNAPINLINSTSKEILYTVYTNYYGRFEISYSFLNKYPGNHELLISYNGSR
ncbi:MAG: hypothetical protein QXL15_00140, partial [Candidatus Korarchaeota archaeon]